MSAPQIIMLAMIVLDLAAAFYLDGKPKFNLNYSFKWTLLTDALFVVVLLWGGFWR